MALDTSGGYLQPLTHKIHECFTCSQFYQFRCFMSEHWSYCNNCEENRYLDSSFNCLVCGANLEETAINDDDVRDMFILYKGAKIAGLIKENDVPRESYNRREWDV